MAETATTPVKHKLDEWLGGIHGTVCFSQKMKVYAPTCYGRCENEVEKLIADLNKVLGGTTVYHEATGCWFDKRENKVECEPVRVIEAAHSCSSDEELAQIVDAIATYARDAKQYAVSIVNGQFFIAETEHLLERFKELEPSLPY